MVPPEGRIGSRIAIVAERPGITEVKEGRPLVGPSGIELFGGWYREGKYGPEKCHTGVWERYVGVPREDLYITNLVKTFRDGENPEDWEIEEWGPVLSDEMRKFNGGAGPSIIVAVGAFAARWFLQDRFRNMDLQHGIPYWWTSSQSVVIPVYHPAYALRAPEMQSALAWDMRQVRRLLDGELTMQFVNEQIDRGVVPTGTTILPLEKFRSALPELYHLGLDTEGTITAPECVTLAVRDMATICYMSDAKGLVLVQSIIDSAASVVMHAAVHDLHVTRAMGLRIDRLDDTMLMARLVQEFEGEQGLKLLSYRRLGLVMTEYQDLVGPIDDDIVLRRLGELRIDTESQIAKDPKAPIAKTLKKILSSAKKILDKSTADSPRKRWERSKVLGAIERPAHATWLSAPRPEGEAYATTDPWATINLATCLRRELKEKRLDRVYRINKGVLPMLARMEERGVAVDTEKLDALAAEFEMEYFRVCKRIKAMVGREVNPNTPEDVAHLLFDQLGVTDTKRTKGGRHASTEDKYLEARKHEHPVIPLIIAAREVWKHRSYCVGGIAKTVDENGLRTIHPDFRYTRVVTGRLAEWLLTIPKHTEAGKKIRSAFIARPGRELLSMDMSQIELRAAAHLSKCPVLTEVYNSGLDIHAKTAHEVLGAPARKQDQDESLHRLPAKTTNFSILMGVTEYGLADSINEALASAFARRQGRVGVPGADFPLWDSAQAKELIDGWYRVYVGVRQFNNVQRQAARRHGYVVDSWGRRRYVAGVHSHNRWIREAAEREAQSFAYQASAQGLMHVWMAKVWAYLEHHVAEPWLQVHDDLTLEVDPAHRRQTATDCMGLLPQLWRVPVASDAKSGPDWGHLSDFSNEVDRTV